MRGLNSNTVDLVYLDPPFNSNRNYSAPVGSKAAGAAFKDMWTLSDIDECEHGELADRSPKTYEVIKAARSVAGKGMQSYLIFMAVRLLEMRRLLKDSGSIYLHCDDTAGAYLKLLMDAMFGRNNYRNEITWQRTASLAKGSQYKSRMFGRTADRIFIYSVSANYHFEEVFGEITTAELDERFPKVDDQGRRYNTANPIFRSPSAGARPNLCYTYKGVTNPHPSGWRVSKSKLMEMDKRGEIIWRGGKRPLRKTYAKDYKGKPLGNVWTDISNARGAQSTGYPTQKPLALLERIIEASSNEGDVVFDPFCGCATTLVAAHKLKRSWIGCDLSPLAVKLVNQRIRELQPFFTKAINPDGPPSRTDVTGIQHYRKSKHRIFGLQEGRCNGCREMFPYQFMEVDHILPKSKGGTDAFQNLQVLCSHCNKSKGNKTMAEWKAARKKLL